MTCHFDGCKNPAVPGQSRCPLHTLRWLPGRPVEREPEMPEWRRRGSAKDLTGWSRAA